MGGFLENEVLIYSKKNKKQWPLLLLDYYEEQARENCNYQKVPLEQDQFIEFISSNEFKRSIKQNDKAHALVHLIYEINFTRNQNDWNDHYSLCHSISRITFYATKAGIQHPEFFMHSGKVYVNRDGTEYDHMTIKIIAELYEKAEEYSDKKLAELLVLELNFDEEYAERFRNIIRNTKRKPNKLF